MVHKIVANSFWLYAKIEAVSYTPFMYLCRRILCLNVCTVITLFCGITEHKGKRESLSLLLWNVSRWFNAFIWLMWKMSCSKTFFNLRIKTLDKKGTSILNKACYGRFWNIENLYIPFNYSHCTHMKNDFADIRIWREKVNGFIQ